MLRPHVRPGGFQSLEEARLHRPVNFDYPSVLDDLIWLVDALQQVNPGLQWVLTVSPVPLVATHTNENVLVASTYSKSVLRAVCGAVTGSRPNVTYFPSYEIISSPQSFGQYLGSNRRDVTDRGIAHVMEVFDRALFDRSEPVTGAGPVTPRATDTFAAAARALEAECDELLNDSS